MALGDQIAVLDGTGIAQAGTPEEIYLRPAALDIATQFGDPSINLLDVVPQGDASGSFVEISGQRVALPPGYAPVHGRECVLGMRPEALCFTSDAKASP